MLKWAEIGGGPAFDAPFAIGRVWSFVLSDIVQDSECQTQPRELKPGERTRLTAQPVAYLYEVFRRMPNRGNTWSAMAWHLTTRYFTNALREVRRRFERVEVDRLRVKPVVKITGEFYVQNVEGAPNYNIHRWLEAEGAEATRRRARSGSTTCCALRGRTAKIDEGSTRWRALSAT